MLQSKPGSSLFLGIELATDQLRATLVDDNLELMGVECVDFDTEVPEYQSVFPSSTSCLPHNPTPSPDFNSLGGAIGRAFCELTALTSCPGRRAVFSPRRAMHTRLRSTCGSKHSVRLHSISYSPNGSNFCFPLYLVLFWYLDLTHPPLRPPLRKAPQKPRSREDTCNRWLCSSQCPFVVTQTSQFISPTS